MTNFTTPSTGIKKHIGNTDIHSQDTSITFVRQANYLQGTIGVQNNIIQDSLRVGWSHFNLLLLLLLFLSRKGREFCRRRPSVTWHRRISKRPLQRKNRRISTVSSRDARSPSAFKPVARAGRHPPSSPSLGRKLGRRNQRARATRPSMNDEASNRLLPLLRSSSSSNTIDVYVRQTLGQYSIYSLPVVIVRRKATRRSISQWPATKAAAQIR